MATAAASLHLSGSADSSVEPYEAIPCLKEDLGRFEMLLWTLDTMWSITLAHHIHLATLCYTGPRLWSLSCGALSLKTSGVTHHRRLSQN